LPLRDQEDREFAKVEGKDLGVNGFDLVLLREK
jgi:hypothetical protein